MEDTYVMPVSHPSSAHHSKPPNRPAMTEFADSRSGKTRYSRSSRDLDELMGLQNELQHDRNLDAEIVLPGEIECLPSFIKKAIALAPKYRTELKEA